jgi:hypothetical protein
MKSKYQQQLKGSGKVVNSRLVTSKSAPTTAESLEKQRQRKVADDIDGKFGFDRFFQVRNRRNSICLK